MGMHCPNCHSRVSHKWFIKYIFCDDYCRTQFIKKIQQLKIPIHFNGGKRKHQNYKKRHPRLFPNPTSLINNSVDSTPKALDQCVQTDCLKVEGK
jgi:hypothetical protein